MSQTVFIRKPHWKMFMLTLICMRLFTLFIGAQLALIKPVIDRLMNKTDRISYEMEKHHNLEVGLVGFIKEF